MQDYVKPLIGESHNHGCSANDVNQILEFGSALLSKEFNRLVKFNNDTDTGGV